MGTPETRQRANILITGSPGTGKTTLGQMLAERLGFDFIECGKEVREHELYSGYDDELKCHILDEDKLLDHIEDRLNDDRGGCIVDYHGCDFFPERWFDIVVVLRCNNTILYDRLAARGYSDKKIRENVECEIFGSLLDEARDAYKVRLYPYLFLIFSVMFTLIMLILKEELIHELPSETSSQMNENVERIAELALSFKAKSILVACEYISTLFFFDVSLPHISLQFLKMCKMWEKIRYGVRWKPSERLALANRGLDLRNVKSISISMDPFYRGYNGHKIVFKTDGMQSFDVVMQFNRLLGNKEFGKAGVRRQDSSK
ncbi:unnamed protein product [Anisakis simplex]|uniref:Adenylate kinase isoenzyme 6 homolog n=1 Tax=Anisakis simplex TaxID=6269 RepID=A0A0M3IY16_ANISI|nr:unnamed protein product [Anisakis simplex]